MHHSSHSHCSLASIHLDSWSIRVECTSTKSDSPQANVIKYSSDETETETQPRCAERDSRRATRNPSSNHIAGILIGGTFNSCTVGLSGQIQFPLRFALSPYIGDNFFYLDFCDSTPRARRCKMGALRRVKTKRRTRYALLIGSVCAVQMKA